MMAAVALAQGWSIPLQALPIYQTQTKKLAEKMLQPAKGLQGSTTRRIWDWSPESMWVWCQVLVIPSLGEGEIRLFLWFSVQLYWCTLVGFADGGRGITSSRPVWGYLVRRPNWFRFGEPWVSIWVLRKQKQKQTNKWQLRKCNIQGFFWSPRAHRHTCALSYMNMCIHTCTKTPYCDPFWLWRGTCFKEQNGGIKVRIALRRGGW